ncbi:MAG: alpha-galactosidase [Acidobacteria bacterium]|nr:MAG: alpha-galactosidase [Acidobacteriota bacterium]
MFQKAVFAFIACCLFQFSFPADQPKLVQLAGKDIRIEYDQNLRSRVVATQGKVTPLGPWSEAEQIETSPRIDGPFKLQNQTKQLLRDEIGAGTRHILIGRHQSLEKRITIDFYADFPAMAVTRVLYRNVSNQPLEVKTWVNDRYSIEAAYHTAAAPAFWSYQPGSYESRPDWVLPLKPGFAQDNYLGMNATDYGGGTPVSVVWRRDVGIAVGHLSPTPKLVSLPISVPDARQALVGVKSKVGRVLKPGETFETLRTFVSVQKGDFFRPLSQYRRLMARLGVRFDSPSPAAYESIWCAWGFERDFTVTQILEAVPKAAELGYGWAVLDDGWQTSEGDWKLDPAKFPKGDADMAALVDKIHRRGLKARLWWAPLAVDPGTDLIQAHPDYLLLNQNGSRQSISWWDAYYLCPAYPPVLEYTKALVERFVRTWGYDGLKIDGQHLNAAPPCHNSAHGHLYPEESFEKMPEFFKAIYDTARAVKPNAVLEVCPCGTGYSFFAMPFMSHGVASDPTSSWQIRLKGKTLKALMGPEAPYFGDHVELSDGGEDFASSFGIGAVIGTKFTWPLGAEKGSKIDLSREREAVWKKWLDLYKQKMLSNGTYLGELYDIGFDRPEAHAIRKGRAMYYAFYDKAWKGVLTLRGLEARQYRVVDYVNGVDYGAVKGPEARLNIDFQKSLLLEVRPE